MKKKKLWYDYLWIWTIIYFALGFFNILFAWFGMIDFLLPLGIAILVEINFSVIICVDVASFLVSLVEI